MKLHILSDLHLECGLFVPLPTDAEVVILAGDIWNGDKGIRWARDTFPNQEIICVAGNHEFYGAGWEGLLAQCRIAASQHAVHFLENDRVDIGGVRFLGASLWVDFGLNGEDQRSDDMKRCAETQTDYVEIEATPRLTPGDVRERHLASRAWLSGALAVPFQGKTVVVTHHLPSARSLPPERQWYHVAYASNADALLGKSAVWVHGHVHHSCDYLAEGTRVVCNPRGCVRVGSIGNSGFVAGYVIEI